MNGTSWNSQSIGDCCSKFSFNGDQVIRLVFSVVLAGLAALATYYCITRGLALQDRAITSLERFGAGFLLYMGGVGSLAATINFLYGTCYNCCNDKYTPPEAGIQCIGTICAPVAVIPLAVCAGLQAAAKG